MRASAFTLLLASLAACGGGASGAAGGWPTLVPPREVDAASGAPRVARVRDLGEPVPLGGSDLRLGSRWDGKFTIGEYVLVEGDDFGKLPTVLIGGRPARVLARTAGGGIVTQIPTGLAGGATSVEVSHPGGRHAASIEVRRYVLAVRPGSSKVHLLAVAGAEVDREDVAPGLELAHGAAFSVDGAWAYVATGEHVGGSGADGKQPIVKGDPDRPVTIATIALTAPGGPAVTHRTPGKTAVIDLALAGKLLAVLGPSDLQLFALDEPGTPAPYDPWPLPAEIVGGKPVAVDLSPDAGVAAVLTEDNRVHMISLATPEAPAEVIALDVVPAQRLPLARDLRFDGAGTLWIVSGDSPRSLAVGHQATRLARVVKDGEAWRVASVMAVAGAGPPLALMPSPRKTLESATTIGDTVDDLPIFVTTIDQKLVPLHGGAGGREALVAAAGALAEPGQIVRTDANGRGGPMPSLAGAVTGGLAVTPDARLVLAAAWKLAGSAAVFGVWVAPLEGGAAPRFVELEAVNDGPIELPGSLGTVVVQP